MEEKNRVSFVIVVSTLVIIAILGSSWVISNSLVIQAELYDSIVDLLYSIIIVSGFLLSRRERKPRYPEGLIRLEPIIASVVGTIVIGTGSYIIYNSIQNIGVDSTTEFSITALLLLILSTTIKLFLYLYVRNKSEKLDSSSLYATSVDLRNDLLTHLASIVGFVSVTTQFKIVEPLIATVIATYILFSGFRLIQKNIPNILGFSVDQDKKEELRQVILSHEEVFGIHDYEVHFTGDMIDISVHIEVDGSMSINEGHQLEISVADSLRESADHRINEINLHLDPDDLGEWKEED